MATLEQFKAVLDDYSPEQLSDLATQYVTSSGKAVQQLMQAAQAQGIDLSSDAGSDSFSEEDIQKAAALMESYKGPEAVYEALIDQAKAKGIDLDAGEIEVYLHEMNDNDEFSDIELGPEALEMVSGGGWFLGGLLAKGAAFLAKKAMTVTAGKVAAGVIGPSAILGAALKKAEDLPWYA